MFQITTQGTMEELEELWFPACPKTSLSYIGSDATANTR